jgi:hypothetical protein
MEGKIRFPCLSWTMVTLPFLLNPTTEKVVPKSTPTVVTRPLNPKAASKAHPTVVVVVVVI